MFLVIGGLSMMSHHYTLGNIKSRTVGDGQHGTARWATDKEIRQTYAHVPFKVREWRRGQNLPMEQQPSGEKRRPGQHGGEGNLRREVHHGGRSEHRGGKRPDVSRRNGGSVPGQKGKMSPAKKAAFAKKRKK